MTTAGPSIGLTFVPQQNTPESLPDFARMVEEGGLDELWLWEDCFSQSAIAAATVALSVTSRIRVGVALMPTPLRNVALTAMEVGTLARIYPGRLLPGIGHGLQNWMAQAGARVASPLTLLEEYATALRGLLAGEQVTSTGRYVKLDRVQLQYPPAVVPPLFIGGFGAKTLALAVRAGDGILLAQNGPAAAARMAGHLADAGRRAEIVLAVGSAEGAHRVDRVGEVIREAGAAGASMVAVVPAADQSDLPELVEAMRSAKQSMSS